VNESLRVGVMLVQYDEIEPTALLERCSLSETRYLLERCIGLFISKVSIMRVSCLNCHWILPML